MPAATPGRQARKVSAAIRRPASGISIDPSRLAWWRESRGWSREDLSDEIGRLGLSDEEGELTVTRDAIAKIENGERKPKARTVRVLCVALSTEDNPCTPRDLMPGGEPLTPHAASVVRRSRLDHNRELREFAVRHGIRYKNDGSGRVYYSKPLRTAYDLMVNGASEAEVEAAAAVARVPLLRRDAQPGPQDSEPDARDRELLAS